MKRTLFAALLGVTSLLVVSCGGGGGSSSSSDSGTNSDGGFAPDALTSDVLLCPTDYDAGGQIWLTATPARVAYFNSERNQQGNYVDSTGAFDQGRYTYTGNYTYTKCGPNMAELKVVNLRAEPADTADDCHWTVIGHLTFVNKETVIFTGTETLISSHTAEDLGNDDPDDHSGHNENHNDPMAFGGQASNHFPGVQHDDGGSRNFSLNYTFTAK